MVEPLKGAQDIVEQEKAKLYKGLTKPTKGDSKEHKVEPSRELWREEDVECNAWPSQTKKKPPN